MYYVTKILPQRQLELEKQQIELEKQQEIELANEQEIELESIRYKHI